MNWPNNDDKQLEINSALVVAGNQLKVGDAYPIHCAYSVEQFLAEYHHIQSCRNRLSLCLRTKNSTRCVESALIQPNVLAHTVSFRTASLSFRDLYLPGELALAWRSQVNSSEFPACCICYRIFPSRTA